MGRCGLLCMALHACTSVWQCDAQGLPQWFCERTKSQCTNLWVRRVCCIIL